MKEFTIDSYLEAKKAGGRYIGKPASRNTLRTYRLSLERAEALLGKPLKDFKEEDGDVLMPLLDQGDFSSSTKALTLVALRGAFSWAIGLKLYPHAHPFAGIQTTQEGRRLPTILTRDQLKEYFDYFYEKPQYQLMFKLMYYGGLRISEATNLKKKNVREDGVVIDGKGNKQRYVYLPEGVRTELRCWIEETPKTEWVFPTWFGKPADGNYLRQLFREAVQALGLPKELHPHSLRHSSATHFYAATQDMALTQKMLGHANISTTLLYAQISDQQLHDAQRKAFGD